MQHNKRNWLLWLLPTPGNIIFTLLIISGILWAQSAGAITLGVMNAPTVTNTLIPYQGRLTDADGNLLSGKHTMAFSLYNQATDGDPLWTEGRFGLDSVELVDGLFNVMLGDINPLNQSVITENSVLYLGITIGTNPEMSPRVQLGAVPYAVHALSVADGSITKEKLASNAIEHIILVDSVQGTTEEELSRSITLSEPGTLIMTGYGRSHYQGSTVSAGNIAILSINNSQCALDRSFEGSSNNIDFHASATCIRHLDVGTHTLKVENYITRGNRQAISFDYVVLREN